YMLVMECGEEGDMRNYLRVHNQDLSWSEKIYLLRDTVSALSVLHQREFVHGDLHTGNILKKRTKPSLLNRLGMTNGHKRMCIVDLPLSYVSTQLFGVIPYIAPEVFSNGYYTKASDVYSFGMVMWELAVGQTPYHDYSHDKDLIDDICRGVRPDIEKIIPQFYVDLMTQCWDPEPLKRPSAHMIKASIERWISTLKKSSVMPSKEQQSILSQIKNSDELAKKSFKRQTRINSMVSSSPTIAATFHSQNLGDILTLDGRSTTSSRKSSSYRH
ncbi:17320_t:CDS:2, partial [Acaulospora morrowiae]